MSKHRNILHSRNNLLHGIMVGTFLLFIFRVIAQLLQCFFDIAWLPPFEAWHSNTFPYPILVGAQFVIIAIGVFAFKTIAINTRMNEHSPKNKTGPVITSLGVVYALAMIGRLIGGLYFFPNHHWFNAPIPTYFHLVLATFVIAWGSSMSCRSNATSD